MARTPHPPDRSLVKEVNAKSRAIRLAQLVWRQTAINEVPIGPQLISAMEHWVVPIHVYDYFEAPPKIRGIFAQTPVWEEFDANTIAGWRHGGIRYVVVYNGQKWRERVWWSLAHEFGHIILQHALSDGWHDNPVKEREADVFAAELLLPIGAVQEVRRWPIANIAQLFGTSLEATRNRLKDLAQGWLKWYGTTDIQEGRERFIRSAGRRVEAKSLPKGPVIMTNATTERTVVQWSQDIEVIRLALCPDCGFENNSQFRHREIRCGACGTLLINACENAQCDLYALPLPSEYRVCGRCGQNTSWVRLNPEPTPEPDSDDPNEQWEPQADEETVVPELPDELPF